MSNGVDRLKEYREKVKAGEIKPPKPKDPIQKAIENPKSLRLAINAKSYDCSCHQRLEVTQCTVVDCPLYNLRPWQKKERG